MLRTDSEPEISVADWSECRAKFEEITSEYPDATILFRGQSDAAWQLETTLERRLKHIQGVEEYFELIRRIKPQLEGLTGTDWHLTDWETVSKHCKSYDAVDVPFRKSYSYLAHLRHHGFPSPLLDWSASPYVASYFAFADLKEGVQDVAIYAFVERPHMGKSWSSADPSIFTLGPFVKTHHRHYRQQSQYSYCLKFEHDQPVAASRSWRFAPHYAVIQSGLRKQDLVWQQDLVWKIVVPARERAKVLRYLNQHNLNHYSLFGTEEALLQTLADREIDMAGRR